MVTNPQLRGPRPSSWTAAGSPARQSATPARPRAAPAQPRLLETLPPLSRPSSRSLSRPASSRGLSGPAPCVSRGWCCRRKLCLGALSLPAAASMTLPYQHCTHTSHPSSPAPAAGDLHVPPPPRGPGSESHTGLGAPQGLSRRESSEAMDLALAWCLRLPQPLAEEGTDPPCAPPCAHTPGLCPRGSAWGSWEGQARTWPRGSPS